MSNCLDELFRELSNLDIPNRFGLVKLLKNLGLCFFSFFFLVTYSNYLSRRKLDNIMTNFT